MVGVDGTNSYGAGLARALTRADYIVKEVLRPTRRVRRMDGKSDPIDAVAAVRTVLSGYGLSEPKATTTVVESLRFLLKTREQLITMLTALGNCMTSLLVTAPEPVREKYRGLSRSELIERLSMCRPAEQLDTPHAAALYSLRELARSHQRTQQQSDDLENQMLQLLTQHLPQLLNIYGASTIVAT